MKNLGRICTHVPTGLAALVAKSYDFDGMTYYLVVTFDGSGDHPMYAIESDLAFPAGPTETIATVQNIVADLQTRVAALEAAAQPAQPAAPSSAPAQPAQPAPAPSGAV